MIHGTCALQQKAIITRTIVLAISEKILAITYSEDIVLAKYRRYMGYIATTNFCPRYMI